MNVFNKSPEDGFQQFLDHPRYSTGYASLWNTPGMMLETHMLKPYSKRVKGTYELMHSLINLMETEGENLAEATATDRKDFQQRKEYLFNFEVDSSTTSTLNFKGYKAEQLPSKVTGMSRLHFDESKPFEKEIPYYHQFSATDTVQVPEAYVIPKAWNRVIDLLQLNKIEMNVLGKDSVMEVETYRIADFKTTENPYEGHYLHYDTEVESSLEKMAFKKGDVVVPVRQKGIRYVLETLEPIAPDSFFNWNFFDSILQQKEHFSAYVFEETAEKFLAENPSIKEDFETKRKTDYRFRNNAEAQLEWIYKKTKHYEKAHLRYPIFRVLN